MVSTLSPFSGGIFIAFLSFPNRHFGIKIGYNKGHVLMLLMCHVIRSTSLITTLRYFHEIETSSTPSDEGAHPPPPTYLPPPPPP